MKKNVLIIIGIVSILLFGSGITFSIFHSSASITTADQKLAKFVFDAQDLDRIQLSLIDLKPGVNEEYSFSVKNNNNITKSDVSILYEISIKTYHFIPLEIKLYEVGTTETLIMTCDESYSRNSNSEIICNSDPKELDHSINQSDNYKLKVSFPSNFNDIKYSNLVDFIDVEIKSWQKI